MSTSGSVDVPVGRDENRADEDVGVPKDGRSGS